MTGYIYCLRVRHARTAVALLSAFPLCLLEETLAEEDTGSKKLVAALRMQCMCFDLGWFLLCFLKYGSKWWIEMGFVDNDHVSMHIPLQAQKSLKCLR